MSSRFTRIVLAATIGASAFAGWGSRTALAADHKMAVTAVGCLQSEREYRRQHDSRKFAGTGAGLNDEYILIDAVIGGPEMAIAPSSEQESTNCIAARGNGQAFELSGGGEDALAPLVGRRVVIHGMLKHAKDDTGPVGTSGTFTPAPTGGGSILGSDLKLREINVESASLAPVMAAASKDEPVIFGAPEPEPAPPAAAEPQAPPATPAPETPAAPTLPKTASPLPVIGLIGLLCLACGLALRLLHRTRARYS